MVKNIHTTIEEETWKLAVLNGIPWNKALSLGIEAMLGVDKEKEKIKEDITRTEIRLKYLKEQIIKIEEAEKKKSEKNRRKVIMEF